MDILKMRGKLENGEPPYMPGEMILVEKEWGTSIYPFLNHAIKKATANYNYHEFGDCSLEEKIRLSSVHICDTDTTREEKIHRLPDLATCAESFFNHLYPEHFYDSIHDGIALQNTDGIIHTADDMDPGSYGPCTTFAALMPRPTVYPSMNWSQDMAALAKQSGFVFVYILYDAYKTSWEPYDYVIRIRKDDQYE